MILSISVALLCVIIFLILAGVRHMSLLLFHEWVAKHLPMTDQKPHVKFVYRVNQISSDLVNTMLVTGWFVAAWVVSELTQILLSFA